MSLRTPARIEDLISFSSAGLPFNPGVFRNDKPLARQEIIDRLLRVRDQGMDFTLTGGYGGGHVSPEHTTYGTAVDLVPQGQTTYNDLVAALQGAGLSTLVHDAGSGKHVHVTPGKGLLGKPILEEPERPETDSMLLTGKVGEKRTLPNKGAEMAKGYIEDLPMLGMMKNGENANLPSMPTLRNIPDVSVPEQPLVNRLLQQPQQPMMGNQQRQGQPMQQRKDKKGRDLTPLSMALMGIGQSLLNKGLGTNADFSPAYNYMLQGQKLDFQGEEADKERQADRLAADALAGAYRNQGIDIPEGLSDPEQVKELAQLNMDLQQSRSEQDYQDRLLSLREKELQYKFNAQMAGTGDLFNESKDPALILMGLKNDPEKWATLSPDVQAKADEYLDLKVKEAGKVFQNKYTEQQGKIAGQTGIPGSTVRDVEREKALGKGLYETTPEGIQPIAGSEKDMKRKEAEKKDIQELQGMKQDSQIALDTIDAALEKTDALSTGIIGGYTQGVPGTPAHDLQQLISTIESKIGLGRIMEMKQQSRTGATGFGQLSEKELALLTSSLASLKQSQTTEQFKENLEKVKKHYKRVQQALNDELGTSGQTLDDLWGE